MRRLLFRKQICKNVRQGARGSIYHCARQLYSDVYRALDYAFSAAVWAFDYGVLPWIDPCSRRRHFLIPLSIIAYSTGGGMYVLYIVLVIFAIHAIETYFLNPKLMSAKTELPIFFTFTVLIFSEHFFGIWGLIIGIPIFVFLLDILDVTNKEDRSKGPRENSDKM